MNARYVSVAAAMALGMIFCTNAALAAKAGYIEAGGDPAYHAQHLEARHFREGVCVNVGDNVMLRTAPGVKKNVGRIAQGQAVRILETYDAWAKVIVLSSPEDKNASGIGMVGWIGVEYIDCGCSEAAYFGEATPAQADEEAAK